MCSKNTPSCTIDKKSGEYAPIPLNIVCAVIHYLLFLYINEYFYNFFYKILAKYSPTRTKLHHLLKFSRGSMPPNPPSKRVALPCAKRHANTPTFQKIFETPEMKSYIRHWSKPPEIEKQKVFTGTYNTNNFSKFGA